VSTSPFPSEDAARALTQGAALLDVARPADALEHLRRAAALNPADARPRRLLSLALIRLDRFEEALQAAESAIALEPDNGHAHRLRSIALQKLKRPGDARVAALAACRLEPEDPLAHVVLAGALQGAGDEAGALAAAEHAVKLGPEISAAHNQLGLILLAHQRPADAEQAFRAALTLSPEDAAALNNLSVAQAQQGARQHALGGFERATGADPRLSVARANVLRMAEGQRYLRRLSIFCLALGLVLLAAERGSGRAAAITPLALVAVFELLRWRIARGFSATARTLIADDARARRLHPARWDWRWPTRLRPWWWLLLQRAPTELIVPLNVGLLVLAALGRLWVWVVVLGLGLPFSARRVWRVWRRAHPGSGSWRPPPE
jgi:Flp pilus assembly protein TadD